MTVLFVNKISYLAGISKTLFHMLNSFSVSFTINYNTKRELHKLNCQGKKSNKRSISSTIENLPIIYQIKLSILVSKQEAYT